MSWKVGVVASFVAASLLAGAAVAVAAEPARPPAAAEASPDTLESAVARVGDLSRRLAALGEEATKQRTQLEALRVRLVEDFRQQAGAAFAKGKELDEARAALSASQKQVTDLRAEIAARDKAPRPQDQAKELQAKDAEIASLRAEVQKLKNTIADARAEHDKTLAATQKVAQDAGGIQAVAATSGSPDPATPPADGSAIKKWQRPDGTLFFGERPPEGSKFLGYTTGGGL